MAMVWDADGTFYVYKPADPRVEATLALGLVSAPSVETLANGDETFYYTLSYEKLDELTSDILVSFADTQKLSDAFLASTHGKTHGAGEERHGGRRSWARTSSPRSRPRRPCP